MLCEKAILLLLVSGSIYMSLIDFDLFLTINEFTTSMCVANFETLLCIALFGYNKTMGITTTTMPTVFLEPLATTATYLDIQQYLIPKEDTFASIPLISPGRVLLSSSCCDFHHHGTTNSRFPLMFTSRGSRGSYSSRGSCSSISRLQSNSFHRLRGSDMTFFSNMAVKKSNMAVNKSNMVVNKREMTQYKIIEKRLWYSKLFSHSPGYPPAQYLAFCVVSISRRQLVMRRPLPEP